MKEATSRLLAYSKEFFFSGERELDQNTSIAYMQAVLKFHDAVEYCVRAIVEEYSVSHDRNADLLPLMKSVNKAIPQKKLPLVSQMDFLNTTRGKIKHHASVPSYEDAQRCRLHARDFLEKVTKDYLGVSFLSVSRLLLIEDKAVREFLEKAEEEKREGQYLEALIQAKKAFYVARPSERTFVSKDSFFDSFFLTSGFREIRELRQPIEKIVNKVNDIEESVALLMMGVDVLKLRRFEEITPHFSFYINRDCSIIWNDSIVPTGEIVDEAINYIVDMTLLWQRMGVVGKQPEWQSHVNRPQREWREVRREQWHYSRVDSATNDIENK